MQIYGFNGILIASKPTTDAELFLIENNLFLK